MSNNVSDISADSVNNGGAASLPIRFEKRLHKKITTLTASEQNIVAAKSSAFKDYITIQLIGRGGSTPGVFDPNSSSEYRFLITPSEVQVTRQALDEQALTRSGWQIGVQGEDFIVITMQGKTPGKYYADNAPGKLPVGGITDVFAAKSASYRNLLALEVVFENNGYWFEGEQVASSLQSSNTRIKAHQDVRLTVGEFIWDGMFESFEVTEDADTPFLSDFSLVFIAWRETYRKETPYYRPVEHPANRGHIPQVPTAVVAVTAGLVPAAQTNTAVSSSIQTPQTYFGD